MLAMTIAIYAYCAAMVLASIVNGTLRADVAHFLPLITLLFFPIGWLVMAETARAPIG